MQVKYYKDVFKKLIKSGLTEEKLANELGISRQHIRNIQGKTKGRKPQANLKEEQLRELIRLCKERNIKPEDYHSWEGMGRKIEAELIKKK